MKRTQEQLREYFLDNEALCRQVLTLFSLLSNKTRFRILCLLSESDFCVRDITDIIDAGAISHVSQQLKALSLAGLVTKKRDKKRVYYHLSDRKFRALIRFLKKQYLVPAPGA